MGMIVGMLIGCGSRKLGKPIAKSKRSKCNNKEKEKPKKFLCYIIIKKLKIKYYVQKISGSILKICTVFSKSSFSLS